MEAMTSKVKEDLIQRTLRIQDHTVDIIEEIRLGNIDLAKERLYGIVVRARNLLTDLSDES